MKLLATHAPFLQSRAQLFILPMASDGTVLHTVLARAKTLYPTNYEHYVQACRDGVLMGDVLLERTQKQQTGLGVGGNQGAEYVAYLITTEHAHHNTQASTLKKCLDKLEPRLYELMRYQGLRRIAMLTQPLFKDTSPNVTAIQLWQMLEKIQIPKLTLDVHFDKQFDLAAFDT